EVFIEGIEVVQWQHLGDVLVRSNDDDRTLGTVHAAQIIQVLGGFQSWDVAQQAAVGFFCRENLFEVFQPEFPLGRLQQFVNIGDNDVQMVFLADGIDIKSRVAVRGRISEPVDCTVNVSVHAFTPVGNGRAGANTGLIGK